MGSCTTTQLLLLLLLQTEDTTTVAGSKPNESLWKRPTLPSRRLRRPTTPIGCSTNNLVVVVVATAMPPRRRQRTRGDWDCRRCPTHTTRQDCYTHTHTTQQATGIAIAMIVPNNKRTTDSTSAHQQQPIESRNNPDGYCPNETRRLLPLGCRFHSDTAHHFLLEEKETTKGPSTEDSG